MSTYIVTHIRSVYVDAKTEDQAKSIALHQNHWDTEDYEIEEVEGDLGSFNVEDDNE